MSDVRAFGATGDGRSDDTNAIRHAIESGDGNLVFEPGEYKISETIEFDLKSHGPLSINGSGGTAKIVMAGAGPAFRLIGSHEKSAHPHGIDDQIWKTERMPMISDISITGAHDQADGVELVKTFQATVSSVHIRNCRHGIRIREHNRNVAISNCHIFHNRGCGLLIDDCNLHQINVIGNHISYNRFGGIRIANSQVYNLQITGNDIEYNNEKSHGTEAVPVAEIWIDSTGSYAIVNEVTISSNTIQATISKGGCNIRIIDDNQHPELRRPGLYSITGNVIGNQENNIHLTGCHGITITGNTIYSCERHNALIEDSDQIVFSSNIMRRHGDAFRCGVQFQRCKNSIVQGCLIEDEHPEGQPGGISTLQLVECERISINGCQLLSGVPHCLDVIDSRLINVSNCLIDDARTKKITEKLVSFSGQGAGNRIGGCTFGRSRSQSIQCSDQSSLVVDESNVFEASTD